MFTFQTRGGGKQGYTDCAETSHHLMHRGLQVTLSLQEESQVHNRMGACVDILFSYFIMPNYQVLGAPLCLLLRIYWWKQGCKCGLLQIHIRQKRSPGKIPLTWWPPGDPGLWEEKEQGLCAFLRCVCVCACECGCIITSSHTKGVGHELLGQFFPFCLQRGTGPVWKLGLLPCVMVSLPEKPSRIRHSLREKYWPVTVAFSLFPGRRATLPVSPPTALRSTRIP